MSRLQPLVSVIIPVYNEERNIASVVEAVAAVPIPKEILIVDDDSTDASYAIINEVVLRRHPDAKIFRHRENRGKGAAIKTALGQARGDVVLIQDADFEYDPADYPKLLAPILAGQAEAVYGSRFLGSVAGRWRHRHGVRLLSLMASLLYGGRITDEATCYKAIRTDVLRSIGLRCEGFEFCPEVTAKLRKRGHRIVEVPISYQPRSVQEGKKLKWRHGIQAFWTLLKYRVTD